MAICSAVLQCILMSLIPEATRAYPWAIIVLRVLQGIAAVSYMAYRSLTLNMEQVVFKPNRPLLILNDLGLEMKTLFGFRLLGLMQYYTGFGTHIFVQIQCRRSENSQNFFPFFEWGKPASRGYHGTRPLTRGQS